MEAPKLQLKLFIDTKAKKLLFAEAGKDFVDFLFYFISLPISTVVRLLNKQSEVGCLDDLYAAIENLDNAYIQKDVTKDYLLNPRGAVPCTKVPLLLSDLKAPKVYTILSGANSVAYVNGSGCDGCRGLVYTEITDVVSHVAKSKKDIDKVLKLVKASLDCKTVLTSVFLGNKGPEILKEKDEDRT